MAGGVQSEWWLVAYAARVLVIAFVIFILRTLGGAAVVITSALRGACRRVFSVCTAVRIGNRL